MRCACVVTGALVSVVAWSGAARAGDGGDGIALPLIDGVTQAGGLSSPLAFIQDPHDPRVQFVVQQRGLIRVVFEGVLQGTNFLDLTGIVNLDDSEGGLLGLAFSPPPGDDRFYVCYTDRHQPEGETHIVRYERMPGNPMQGDPNSAEEILFIDQPFSNHNGGNMAFGMDGYLYIGMGDGGSSGDPGNRAQTSTTLLGKMLRIDVSGATGYAIPADNPFVDNDPIDALEEIWAFGTRNPWRWSFDNWLLGGTGAMLMADVGQNAIEEVNYEEAGDGANNYGWRRFEGNNLFSGGTALAYKPHHPPIHTYNHGVGLSITGGYVYRGCALGSAFHGRYFFADFINSRLWSGQLNQNGKATTLTDVIEHTGDLGGVGNVSSFGEDAEGELYIVSFNGTVRKIVPQFATPLTSSTVLWGNHLGGTLPQLVRNDNNYVRIRSRFGFTAQEPNLVRLQVEADAAATAPVSLDICIESRNDTAGAAGRLRLFNWDTNILDEIGTIPLGMNDSRTEFHNIANRMAYLRDNDGLIRADIRHFALAVFTVDGFLARIDQVVITAPQ